MSDVVMSTLPKTWILDLDGTVVKHNGYKIDGEDTLLSGAKEYIDALPEDDRVVREDELTGAFGSLRDDRRGDIEGSQDAGNGHIAAARANAAVVVALL